MKRLINISLIVAFIFAFASCEKEDFSRYNCIEHDSSDEFDEDDEFQTRGGDDLLIDSGDGDGDGDGVVDPDEDDDDMGGKDDGVVDPDEDDDDLKEEAGK